MSESNDEQLFREEGGIRYRLMALPDFLKFREMALGESGEWKEHYKDDLTRVESRPPGDDSTALNIIRVRRVMPEVPPSVLYDQLHDADYRATWDDKMIEGYNITQLDAHNDIGYYSAKFPWPLTNRDFCNQRSWMEFTNGEFVIFNHSEPHVQCPEKKNFVRAKSILTGYFIQPWQNGVGTKLTYVTHSDPCGSIPHGVLNYVMTKLAPSLLVKCEEYSKAYPQFCAKKYPPNHSFPWRTPKVDWDGERHASVKAATGAGSEEVEEAESTAGAATLQPAGGLGKPTGAAAGREGFPLSVEYGATTNLPVSLAPVAPIRGDDGLAIQQYRAVLQDAMNTVDRSFLREGRAPTTKEYVVRLTYVIEGIRVTTFMP